MSVYPDVATGSAILSREESIDFIGDVFAMDPGDVTRFGLHPASLGKLRVDPVDSEAVFYARTKYAYLTDVAKQAVEEQMAHDGVETKLHKGMAFASGFSVISKFIDKGMAGYKEYCLSTGQQPGLQEVSDMFHRSASAVIKFAGTDLPRNKALEAMYGFREPYYVPDAGETHGFTLEEGSDGLIIVPEKWEQALLRVTGLAVFARSKSAAPEALVDMAREEVFSNTERCEAYRILPSLYRWSINMCAATEEFFGEDIAAIIKDTNE